MNAQIETLLEEIAPVIERRVVAEVAREVRHVLAELRLRDGRDGLPGVPGLPGAKGDPGAPGADGRNGTDGTLEGVTFTQEERTVIVRRADGTEIGRWQTAAILDRGFYRAGATYTPGDAVTYSGALWIAQADTDTPPMENSAAWRRAVKRGEKGATGAKGERGPVGERGAQGLPGGRYA